jgi:hypothetical protein
VRQEVHREEPDAICVELLAQVNRAGLPIASGDYFLSIAVSGSAGGWTDRQGKTAFTASLRRRYTGFLGDGGPLCSASASDFNIWRLTLSVRRLLLAPWRWSIALPRASYPSCVTAYPRGSRSRVFCLPQRRAGLPTFGCRHDHPSLIAPWLPAGLRWRHLASHACLETHSRSPFPLR